ncbi:unnamed protein product [Linum trigynum]|uniref:Uncharacterized protein n=1 Tax=Linum trigynum TaxID=586398 RepID=A0AAV2DI35_9ROSI
MLTGIPNSRYPISIPVYRIPRNENHRLKRREEKRRGRQRLAEGEHVLADRWLDEEEAADPSGTAIAEKTTLKAATELTLLPDRPRDHAPLGQELTKTEKPSSADEKRRGRVGRQRLLAGEEKRKTRCWSAACWVSPFGMERRE